jgi:hypothetical protein
VQRIAKLRHGGLALHPGNASSHAREQARPANVAGFGTLHPAEILLGAMRDAAPNIKSIG